MELNDWTNQLHHLYQDAFKKYQAGQRDAETFFQPPEVAFLASIGILPINLYDYVEDLTKYQEPDWETVLLMMAARRDYFLYEMQGRWSAPLIQETDLPPKSDALEGIPWLPRILVKAEAYLRGALPPQTMYCCGGDRNFLKEHHLHPADFLRIVWSAKGDQQKVVAQLKRTAK